MVNQVFCTPLKAASGGFGEYDWIEPCAAEGCETYGDYEAELPDNVAWEVTDEISGRIHNEKDGRIYKFTTPNRSEPTEPYVTYEMVWVEEVEESE